MIQKYEVMRQIQFDKPYAAGDTYEGNVAEVAHLVANGVLKPIKGKAEPAPKNKAEPQVENKGA